MPATSYAFRVRAEGGSGGGRGWSEPLVVVTDAAVPSPPEPPTLLRREGSSVVVEWPSPASNGKPITHHELQVEPQTGGAPRLYTIGAADGASGGAGGRRASDDGHSGRAVSSRLAPKVIGTASELPSNCHCLFRVRAVNAVGEGPWSAPARFRTQATPPGPPLAFEYGAVGARDVELRWAAAALNGAGVHSYDVGMSDAPEAGGGGAGVGGEHRRGRGRGRGGQPRRRVVRRLGCQARGASCGRGGGGGGQI